MSTAPAGRTSGAVRGQPVGQPRLDLYLQRVRELPEPRPIGRWGLAERLEQAGHESALARKVAIADPSQVRLAPGVGEIAIEPGPEGINFAARVGRHRNQARAAGLASAAALASTANAFGLVTARSASALRSIGLPAAFSPAMSWP